MSDDPSVTGNDAAQRRIAALAHTVTLEDRHRIAPPPDLWAAIDASIDRSAVSAPVVSEVQPPHELAGAAPLPAIAPIAETQPSAPDTVVPMRRPMSTVLLSAAAAVVLVFGTVAIAASGDDDEPRGDLVAAGALEPLADGFEGDVELVDVDGRLQLDVEVTDLPAAPDAYYELWLIKDLETGEMQSLGPIDASGRVALPQGLDLRQYATVDISVEPLDGIPTHSGQSVLRGALDI